QVNFGVAVEIGHSHEGTTVWHEIVRNRRSYGEGAISRAEENGALDEQIFLAVSVEIARGEHQAGRRAGGRGRDPGLEGAIAVSEESRDSIGKAANHQIRLAVAIDVIDGKEAAHVLQIIVFGRLER